MLGFLHNLKIKKRGTRITNATIAGLFVALQMPMVLFVGGGTAFADTSTITWDGQKGAGLANPDCSADQTSFWHWVLTPEGGATLNSATLNVTYTDNSTTTTTGFKPADNNPNGTIQFNVTKSGAATVKSAAASLDFTQGNGNGNASPSLTISDSTCENAETQSVTPAAVTFTDLCGTENDTFTIPTTTGVDYQVDDSTVTAGNHPGSGAVTVDAVAQNGYTLAEDATTEWSHTFTNVACEQENTPVTPADVTFTDECGTDSDVFTIPSTEGVDYQIDGVTQTAGNHPGDGHVVVTAVAQEGFTIEEGATTEWSHTFTNTPCQQENQKVTICHRTDSVTNPYVQITVDVSAVDGSLGNGADDHTGHTGPVATSQDVAQALKDAHNNWGDIIPPYTFGDDQSFPGLNWSTDGQAVYNNDCNYTSGGVLGSSVGSISGMKFNDVNGNDQLDQGESGLSGWTIFLDTNGNGVLDNGERSQVTGSNGTYSFTNLDEGSYRVCEVGQTNWTQTFGGSDHGCYNLTVNAEGTLDFENINFGNHLTAGGQGGGAVLGASTVVSQGHVLGASTLANTGDSAWTSIVLGLVLVGSAGTLAVASRRRSLQI